MRIGICGMGFVGDALLHGLNEIKPGFFDIRAFDPYKIPGSKLSDLVDCEYVFVCVPTPMGRDGGMDVSIVDNVLSNLQALSYGGVVVIKSTVTPVHCKLMAERYLYLRIISNPEFLTERQARYDFLNSKWVLIGGKETDTAGFAKLSKELWPEATVTVVSLEAAMMAKYMTNTWFAVKVSLMNEFYKLYEKMGFTDWDTLIKAFSTDLRVGPTHLQVPGPDGDFGFGGKCFPKDMNALRALAREHETIRSVMDAAWTTNKEVRKNKNWLTIDGAVSEGYEE